MPRVMCKCGRYYYGWALLYKRGYCEYCGNYLKKERGGGITMKEFMIDESYEQICINLEGNIEISGLTEKDARRIGKDANSAEMGCRIFVHPKGRAVITIEVWFNAIILKGRQLTVLLNPNEYPFEAIVINIK